MNVSIHIVTDCDDHYNLLLENVNMASDIENGLLELGIHPASWDHWYINTNSEEDDNFVKNIMHNLVEYHTND